MTSGGGKHILWGARGPVARPLGDRTPVAQWWGDRGPVAQWPGDRLLRGPPLRFDVSGRGNFAKNTLSPSEEATGVHFCKISKRWSKNVN